MPKEHTVGDKFEDGSVLAGIDIVTYKVFYVRGADEYDMLDLSGAREHIRDLNLRSHGIRFRLPTESELTVMFNNRVLIGRFRDAFYLSSTINMEGLAHYRNFNGGNTFLEKPGQEMAVRLVQYSIK